jgi:hypothetical protein
MTNSKNEVPNLSGLMAYDKVRLAGEFILLAKGKISSSKTLSGIALYEEAEKTFPEMSEVAKNTFIQYMSAISKDVDSLITTQGRKQGYYLSETAKNIENIIESSEVVVSEDETLPQQRKQKEILLYEVLEGWLITQGFQSANVSAGRSLGKWGNPDIAGIGAVDTFQGLSIEVVTIEAKTSLDNWEQWIFEAISHRRFANRSYFAFAHPEEMLKKIPQDMRYYAELYNIGVLVISLENELFKKLINGELEKSINAEDVDIIEIFSAPYNFVQPKFQIKFCNALGISTAKDLYQWGAKV